MELTAEGLSNMGVTWQKVKPGTFEPRLRLTGSIAGDPRHVARVGARVLGRVAAVRVALGDRVRRGQELLVIDAVEVHEATLKYLTALARAGAARDAMARQKQLVDERVGALADLRRAESEAAASEAALIEAAEHLRFLGLSNDDIGRIREGGAAEVSQSRLRSPIDGQVASLDVSLGQVLTGNENVITVADVKEVWASLRVYERDLGAVHAGVPVEVQVPAYPERAFAGSVTFVSDVLDPANRSAEVRVSLSNEDGALRPGMSASGFVRKAAGGLWLPVHALQAHDGRTVVFVHTGERHFELRTVVAGSEEGGFRPVEAGITGEDEVVIQGALALRAELERAALQE